jgi:hypothetical protein
LAWLPCGHTHQVFGSGLSRCSPVAMAGGSCQSPPSLLHAAVALHVLHVRAELLLAAVRITPIVGRRVGRQARRCLSILGLTELLRLLGGASLRRDLYCGPYLGTIINLVFLKNSTST